MVEVVGEGILGGIVVLVLLLLLISGMIGNMKHIVMTILKAMP